MEGKGEGDDVTAAVGEPDRAIVGKRPRFFIAGGADDAKRPALELLERGEALLRQDHGHWRQRRVAALALFEQAIERDPKLCNPYALRAETLLDLREYDKAIEACDRALSFEQQIVDKATSEVIRGDELKWWEERREAADALFDHAREAFAYVATLHILRAWAIAGAEDEDFDSRLHLKGRWKLRRERSIGRRYDEALADCTRALELLRGSIDRFEHVAVHLARGWVLRRVGRVDEAIDAYRAALKAGEISPLEVKEFSREESIRRGLLLSKVAVELESAFLDKDAEERYNRGDMNKAEAIAAAAALLSPYSSDERIKNALDNLGDVAAKAEATPRKTTGRATEELRPDAAKVKAAREMVAAHKRGPRVKPNPALPKEAPEIYRDRKPREELSGRKENIVQFIERVYAPWREILTRPDLRRLDETADEGVGNWISYHKQPFPNGLLPTEFELNTAKRLATPRGARLREGASPT